eukprot:3761222-Amphidinium_carterae.2
MEAPLDSVRASAFASGAQENGVTYLRFRRSYREVDSPMSLTAPAAFDKSLGSLRLVAWNQASPQAQLVCVCLVLTTDFLFPKSLSVCALLQRQHGDSQQDLDPWDYRFGGSVRNVPLVYAWGAEDFLSTALRPEYHYMDMLCLSSAADKLVPMTLWVCAHGLQLALVHQGQDAPRYHTSRRGYASLSFNNQCEESSAP